MSRARWQRETLGIVEAGAEPVGYGLAPEPPVNLDAFWALHARCDGGISYGRDELLGEIACAECRSCGTSIWFAEGSAQDEVYSEVRDEG